MNPVFTYYANIVDYLRGIALLSSFFFIQQPLYFIAIYTFSYLLDALDGYLAHSFNQTSSLGAGLDMVLDRSATCSLFSINLIRKPQEAPIWLGLLSLDISSHYLHMLSSIGKSHKTTSPATHGYILHYYYSSKLLLTTTCGFHELFMLFLYYSSWTHSTVDTILNFYTIFPGIWSIPFLISLILGIFKNIVSIIQLQRAATTLATSDYIKVKKS